jgi:hypothetical protein
LAIAEKSLKARTIEALVYFEDLAQLYFFNEFNFLLLSTYIK